MPQKSRGLGIATLLALASCIESSSVRCPDGSVCPSQYECASVVNLAGIESVRCVLPSQKTACDELAEGVACELSEAPAGGADSR